MTSQCQPGARLLMSRTTFRTVAESEASIDLPIAILFERGATEPDLHKWSKFFIASVTTFINEPGYEMETLAEFVEPMLAKPDPDLAVGVSAHLPESQGAGLELWLTAMPGPGLAFPPAADVSAEGLIRTVFEFPDDTPLSGIPERATTGLALVPEIVNHLMAVALRLRPVERPRSRVEVLSSQDVERVVAHFEVPIRHLQIAADDGLISELDEEFVRSTLRQIDETRRRGDEADPRLIEILIADLVKKLVSDLTDVRQLEAEFVRLGADAGTAAVAAERTAEALKMMMLLGGEDPVQDADGIDSISEVGEDLESLRERLVRAGAEAGAGELGSASIRGAGRAFPWLFEETWPHIQIGLVMAWRAVRDRLVSS